MDAWTQIKRALRNEGIPYDAVDRHTKGLMILDVAMHGMTPADCVAEYFDTMGCSNDGEHTPRGNDDGGDCPRYDYEYDAVGSCYSDADTGL